MQQVMSLSFRKLYEVKKDIYTLTSLFFFSHNCEKCSEGSKEQLNKKGYFNQHSLYNMKRLSLNALKRWFYL